MEDFDSTAAVLPGYPCNVDIREESDYRRITVIGTYAGSVGEDTGHKPGRPWVAECCGQQRLGLWEHAAIPWRLDSPSPKNIRQPPSSDGRVPLGKERNKGLRHIFTAPVVRPRMKYFCINMKMRRGGNNDIMLKDINWPQSM